MDNDIGINIDIKMGLTLCVGGLDFVTETNHQRKKQYKYPCQYKGPDRTSDLVKGSNWIERNANGFYDLA